MSTLYYATFNVVTDDPTTALANAAVLADSRNYVTRNDWHPTMSEGIHVISVNFWAAGDNEAIQTMRDAMNATGVPADTLRIKTPTGNRMRVLETSI